MNDEAGSNPFVGLRPFESHESLLFFGRQEQTLELLQRLHEHHFVAVIGSSGSGKSSLVRAGLIPRLHAGYLVNDRDRWAITIMKPGQTPLCNLAETLLKEPLLSQNKLSAPALEQKIQEEGADAILKLLEPLWQQNANFFLLVDQFEELFRFSLHGQDFDKKDEAKDFVNILLDVAGEKQLPIYVVTTMRSDFIGDCSLIYGLPEAMNKSQYIVPRLNRLQLRHTIEGPVRLYKGKINPALTARLLNDAQLHYDELPLLQHVLMRIWDHEKTADRNGELTLDDYLQIGGMEKALSNHADEAMEGMSTEEVATAKRMFQALTTVDENGRKIRRPVRLSELERLTGAGRQELFAIVQRFVEGNKSFLVVSPIPGREDWLLDISHESLIRQWNTLNEWVEEENEAVRVYQRLTETALLYEQGQGDLLSNNELQRVLDWKASFSPDLNWATRYSPYAEKTFAFLAASEKHRRAIQAEKEKQVRQKKRNRRLLVTGLIMVILIISAFAFVIFQNNAENKKKLAYSHWNRSQSARERQDWLRSLHFTVEAFKLSEEEDLAKNLLIDIHPFLPQARLENIFLFPDFINSMVFLPDNKRLALAGNDGTIQFIDKETGRLSGPVMKHNTPVLHIAFSADGKRMISASTDSTARVWETSSGKELAILRHPDGLIRAGISPNGNQALTISGLGEAQLWQTANGEKIGDFTHNETYVATTITNGNVAMAVPASPAVLDAVFNSDGTQFLTAGVDGTVRVWDTKTQDRKLVIEHESTVSAALFMPDGKSICTTTVDSTLHVWRLPAGPTDFPKEVITYKNVSPIRDVAVEYSSSLLAIGGEDGYTRLLHAATGRQSGTALKHEGLILSVAFNPHQPELATTGWDKAIRIWKLPPEETPVKEMVFRHGNLVNAAVFSPDGTKILSGSEDSTARIWDLSTRKQTHSFPHRAAVLGAVFSPDGKQVYTAGSDGLVQRWNLESRKTEASFQAEASTTILEVMPGGKQVIAGDVSRKIYYLQADNLRLMNDFPVSFDMITLAIDGEGKKMVIAGSDSAAHIIEVRSGKETGLFKHQNIVNSAVFNPGGTAILTTSDDMKARVWNVATGQKMGQPMQHKGSISSAGFSANGQWIVTTAWDNTTRIWHMATGQELGSSRFQSGVFTSVRFSPDGNFILAASRDNSVRIWTISADLDIGPHLFQLQAKALTGTKLNLNTGEATCLLPEEWRSLQQQYKKEGRSHYTTCRYPAYNLWRQFEKEEPIRK